MKATKRGKISNYQESGCLSKIKNNEELKEHC